jgi:hypothetical protein
LYFSSSVLSFIGVVYPPLSTGIEIDVAATPPMDLSLPRFRMWITIVFEWL